MTDSFVFDPFSSVRRLSREVMVGTLGLGARHPIRIQSMITSDTMNTKACVTEVCQLVAVGCEMVRITVPTIKDATNLQYIRGALKHAGCNIPLIADVHFKPEVALEAVKWVEKIRINPGNFADSKKFILREKSDNEYNLALNRIREKFTPLVQSCKERGVAMRIGSNHGSLSDRIMTRFGDSPLGMVESALEYARIARELDYHDLVFSMKASNPKIMISAYRLLVTRLHEEGADWNYPIHLGVTEAGDDEDGRIKSAIGIGSLLADGIGDTIRVSLTEDSCHEIPVARSLTSLFEKSFLSPSYDIRPTANWYSFEYNRRPSEKIVLPGITATVAVGGDEPIRVVVPYVDDPLMLKDQSLELHHCPPELSLENLPFIEINPQSLHEVKSVNEMDTPHLITVRDGVELDPILAFRLLASRIELRHPILLKNSLQLQNQTIRTFLDHITSSSTVLGSLLCDGIGDAVLLRSKDQSIHSLRLAYNILQATGVRIFKTDYVSCPSCGRTLFNLQEATAKIKASTDHLQGVRIAIMGCIVNGPGEMADADFGYVGGAPGKVNLYLGKQPVKFNIPETEAVDCLIDLIKKHGRWVERTPKKS